MKLKEQWYKGIQDQLTEYFYQTYFLPILELFKQPLYNSTNDVINAINKGQIVIQGNEISGVFNMRVSAELRKFAKFNKYTKKWHIADRTLIPKDILSASVIANEKARQLQSRLKTIVDDISGNSKVRIGDMDFDISKQAREMDAQLEKERIDLGIKYEMNDRIRVEMEKVYNDNMQLNIKNWDDTQIQRLRDMTQKMALEGFNRQKMIEAIQTEFGTSKSRALFLSRQETSLFMSGLRDRRYEDAGIKIVQWLSSNDNRTRGKPGGKYPYPKVAENTHWALHKKFCLLSDPTVYADTLQDAKNNIWKKRDNIGAPDKHAGTDWNCRCIYKPIVI